MLRFGGVGIGDSVGNIGSVPVWGIISGMFRSRPTHGAAPLLVVPIQGRNRRRAQHGPGQLGRLSLGAWSCETAESTGPKAADMSAPPGNRQERQKHAEKLPRLHRAPPSPPPPSPRAATITRAAPPPPEFSSTGPRTSARVPPMCNPFFFFMQAPEAGPQVACLPRQDFTPAAAEPQTCPLQQDCKRACSSRCRTSGVPAAAGEDFTSNLPAAAGLQKCVCHSKTPDMPAATGPQACLQQHAGPHVCRSCRTPCLRSLCYSMKNFLKFCFCFRLCGHVFSLLKASDSPKFVAKWQRLSGNNTALIDAFIVRGLSCSCCSGRFVLIVLCPGRALFRPWAVALSPSGEIVIVICSPRR